MHTLPSFNKSFGSAFAALGLGLLIGLLPLSTVHAQPVDSLIVHGKQLLEAGSDAGDVDTMRQAAAVFERAASGDTRTALARYYMGLAHSRIANVLMAEDEDAALEHLNAAIEQFKAAVEARDDFAEAYAMLASTYGRKIGLQPWKGMWLGPRAGGYMEKAHALAPGNPRVVLVQAISDYYTPSMFGGDDEAAMQGFRHAIELFEQEEVTDPLQPDWGHSTAYTFLGLAYMEGEKYEQARQAFEHALAVDPEYEWVKNVLLPQVQARLEVAGTS